MAPAGLDPCPVMAEILLGFTRLNSHDIKDLNDTI